MKLTAFMRRALAALLAPALLSVSVLAAGEEPAPRAGGTVSVKDAVCGKPDYKVCDLMGSEGDYEWFDYAVPEGGVAALLFFNPVCGKSQALFQGLSLLTDDPRINVVPVTQAGRAEAQGFADTYIRGKTEHVYYNENAYQNPYDAYMTLLGQTGGTAFVVLATEENGVRTIRWSGTDVSSAQAVKARADAILAGAGTETPGEPEEPEKPAGLVDTVAGREPAARVARLWGGDGSFEPFDYTVPEGGVTALIFFKYACGNCERLLQDLSPLTGDPRINVVAVSLEDAQRAQIAAGVYGLARWVDEVYYAPSNNPGAFYASLLYDRTSVGTAFVILAEEVNGVKYIRWYGEGVSSAQTVRDQADALLEAPPASSDLPASAAVLSQERTGDRLSLTARVANPGGGTLSGRLYAAGFSGARQTGAQSRPLRLPGGGASTETFTVRGGAAKLFYLDGETFRPLMAAVEADGG